MCDFFYLLAFHNNNTILQIFTGRQTIVWNAILYQIILWQIISYRHEGRFYMLQNIKISFELLRNSFRIQIRAKY